MKITFTGEEIAVIKMALLRPTDGANVSTILSIMRLKDQLRLEEDLEPTATIDADLEDQDIKFIKSEWAACNKGGQGLFLRGTFSKEGSFNNTDTFARMERILAVDRKINSLVTHRE